MKIKIILSLILITIILIFVASFAYHTALLKDKSEITRLRGDIAIYKNQIENYERVIRTIRETAATATVVEKAQ